MDVPRAHDDHAANTRTLAAVRPHAGPLSGQRVGQALGEWQKGELRLARRYPQCRGLAHEQLEDLYQETTLALLKLDYHSEEHLRNALRVGIKHRALHVHRDTRRHGQILLQRTPELRLAAQSRADERGPEPAAILREDQMVIAEFAAELTALEQRVFGLMAEQLRHRAIAQVLQIPANEARKALRACERKRERFQLLHDTGRLCGYRAVAIAALKDGRETSDTLAESAYAHLERCAHCRAEHKTNATRLRRSFQDRAAAFLPIPVLAGRLSWSATLARHARDIHARLLPYGSAPGTGGVRERTIAMLASGGAAAKVAAGAATVAVLAGSTIGATQALHAGPSRHHLRSAHASSKPSPHVLPAATAGVSEPATAATTDAGNAARATPPPRTRRPRQPGGFAFLGVPSRTSAPPDTSAHVASAGGSAPEHPTGEAHGVTKVAGGAFSP